MRGGPRRTSPAGSGPCGAETGPDSSDLETEEGREQGIGEG